MHASCFRPDWLTCSHVQGAQESAGSEGDTGDLEEMQALRDRVLQLQVGNGAGSPGLQPASHTIAWPMRHSFSRPASRPLIPRELLTAVAALPLAAAPCRCQETGRRCSCRPVPEAGALKHQLLTVQEQGAGHTPEEVAELEMLRARVVELQVGHGLHALAPCQLYLATCHCIAEAGIACAGLNSLLGWSSLTNRHFLKCQAAYAVLHVL